jgi:hypothetical protein
LEDDLHELKVGKPLASTPGGVGESDVPRVKTEDIAV